MYFNFKDTFEALSRLTDALPQITGIDIWRRPTNKPSLADIDPLLINECVTPPSKLHGQFVGKRQSVWDTLHFTLIMPALQDLSTRAEIKELQGLKLNSEEASQAFGAIDALKKHIAQYHAYKRQLPDMLSGLPDEPCDLSRELRPLYDGETQEAPDNHIVGRLLQAYYIQKNQYYRRNGAPREVGPYLENSKGLFDRTQLYVMNRLKHCPLPINENGQVPGEVSAEDILKTYSWFACPTVVEMVLPNLKGAAAEAAVTLSAFLDKIDYEMDIDLKTFEPSDATITTIQADEKLLERFERMQLMLDSLQEHQAADALETILSKVWSPEQRQKIWNAMDPTAQSNVALHRTIAHAHIMHL